MGWMRRGADICSCVDVQLMLNTVWLFHVFGNLHSLYRELLPTHTVAVLSQAHELHTKHSAEAMKAEKWQFEYKNLHDKYDALLKEKEVSWREIKVQLW